MASSADMDVDMPSTSDKNAGKKRFEVKKVFIYYYQSIILYIKFEIYN